MATIRDVVDALSRRRGVQGVIVIGEDGLPIDAQARDGLDSESVAALVPPVVRACAELGSASGRGDFTASVMEFGDGLAIVTVLGPEATLVILVAPGTDVGDLLYRLSRHRPALTKLF